MGKVEQYELASVPRKLPRKSSIRNFFNAARDRLTSFVSFTEESVDSRGLGYDHESGIHLSGSWSPDRFQKHCAKPIHSNGSYVLKRRGRIFSISDDSFTSTSIDSGLSNTTTVIIERDSDLADSSHNMLQQLMIPTSASMQNFGDYHNPYECTKYRATSYRVVSRPKRRINLKPKGSLESINFDEEDDEDEAFGSSESSTSSPVTFGLTPAASSYGSPSPFPEDLEVKIDQTFTTKMGYVSMADIELYCQLANVLDAGEMQLSGCSRHVARFGGGYEDHCKFPLVLPVFMREVLENKHLTWELIRLRADSCLAKWEYSGLTNLAHRMCGIAHPLGKPVDWICLDPNLYLRKLCTELMHSGTRAKFIHSLQHQYRNRSLKRWNSLEDLNCSIHYGDSKRKEPEFDQCWTIGLDVRKRKSRTDEAVFVKHNCVPPQRYPSTRSRRGSMPKCVQDASSSSAPFNALITSLSSISLSSSDSGSIAAPPSPLLRPYDRNSSGGYCLLHREMALLLNSSPVHFALYVTKFYLEHFRTGFDSELLSSLALFKDIITLNQSHHNPTEYVQSLSNLLKFDDTFVSVVRAHFHGQLTVSSQVRALQELTEAACLLRQLRNFYGLRVLIGAMQGPQIYARSDVWALFAQQSKNHYRDYRKLSSLVRKMNDGHVIGLEHSYIPTLQSLINRIRLASLTTWDLLESKRRFTEHPSLAGWIYGVLSSSGELAYTEPSSISTFTPLLTSLHFDPVEETFLSHCDPVRMTHIKDYPSSVSKRHVSAMPERYLRELLPHMEQFVHHETDLSFRHYQLPSKFY